MFTLVLAFVLLGWAVVLLLVCLKAYQKGKKEKSRPAYKPRVGLVISVILFLYLVVMPIDEALAPDTIRGWLWLAAIALVLATDALPSLARQMGWSGGW
jgi:CDP-diglyceride synthetase